MPSYPAINDREFNLLKKIAENTADIAAGGGGGGGGVTSVNGETGVVVLNASDIGLGNVNNTSDANKPISTATQTALDLKASAAGPTIVRYLSGSGNYTPTAGAKWIRVRMVGGGAGGSGSASSAANAGDGTAGSNTTFGGILTATGGSQGRPFKDATPRRGGAGGLPTSTPTAGMQVAVSVRGGGGGGPSGLMASQFIVAGWGGGSYFGGGGAQLEQAGEAAPANTGAGGCGASVASGYPGVGGGAGGYLEAIFNAALLASGAPFAYAVGAGGTGGAAGTSGAAGGDGAAGQIIIEENF
jgi:hypothetical protein